MSLLTNGAALSVSPPNAIEPMEETENLLATRRYREHPEKDGEVEDQVFASAALVPAGWVHHPNVIEWRPAKPEPKPDLCPHCGQEYDYAAWLLGTKNDSPESKKPEIAELDLDGLDKKDLLEIAREAGVKVDDRWSPKKIKQALREA